MARYQSFLLPVFLIFGLSAHFAESCFTEYSDGSETELGNMQKIFDMHKKIVVIYQLPDALLIQRSQEISTPSTDAALFAVQALIAHYIILFARGYNAFKENNDTNREMESCASLLYYLKSFFGPRKQIFMQHSQRFIERARKRSNTNIIAEAERAYSEFLNLMEKIDQLPPIKSSGEDRFNSAALAELKDVKSKYICPYFGKLLYGRSENQFSADPATETLKDVTMWTAAGELFKLGVSGKNPVGSSSGNDRVTAAIMNGYLVSVLQTLEIPGVTPRGLKGKESLELVEVNNENSSNGELRLITNSEQGPQFFNEKEAKNFDIIAD